MLYPVINEKRQIIDLNGIWNFKLEDDASPVDISKPLDTELVMAVPGSYNDQGVNAKIRNHVGNVWYERTIVIPEMMQDERIVLRFGSATHQATVYIDGQAIVSHKGGFLPFEAELDHRFSTGKHRLSVCVNNILDETTLPVGKYEETIDEHGKKIKTNTPNFDFFNYAGLHRPVKLYTTPKTYIEDIVLVPEVSKDTAQVHFNIMTNKSATDIRIRLLDEANNVVTETTGQKEQ